MANWLPDREKNEDGSMKPLTAEDIMLLTAIAINYADDVVKARKAAIHTQDAALLQAVWDFADMSWEFLVLYPELGAMLEFPSQVVQVCLNQQNSSLALR